MSCLYRLQSRLPVDFDLHAHGNEREAALAHLNVLSANDVVVYDCWGGGTMPMRCFTRMRSGDCMWVFRMKRKTGIDVDRFIHDSCRDTIIEVVPYPDTLTRLRRKGTPEPHSVRTACGW